MKIILAVLMACAALYGQQTPEQKADALRVKKYQDITAKLLSMEQEKAAFLGDWNKACEGRGQKLLWDQQHTIPACMLPPAQPVSAAEAPADHDKPKGAAEPPQRTKPIPPGQPRLDRSIPPAPKQ